MPYALIIWFIVFVIRRIYKAVGPKSIQKFTDEIKRYEAMVASDDYNAIEKAPQREQHNKLVQAANERAKALRAKYEQPGAVQAHALSSTSHRNIVTSGAEEGVGSDFSSEYSEGIEGTEFDSTEFYDDNSSDLNNVEIDIQSIENIYESSWMEDTSWLEDNDTDEIVLEVAETIKFKRHSTINTRQLFTAKGIRQAMIVSQVLERPKGLSK